MSLDVSLTCEHCGSQVFDANITHNLVEMAKEAGIYQPLWRPDELGIERAVDLIEPLTQGLHVLTSEPDRFKTLNPSNGWGSYDVFVPWVQAYLDACQSSPGAKVGAWR